MKIELDNKKCHPFLNEHGCSECLTKCALGVYLSGPQPMPTRPGVPIDHYKVFVAQPKLCVGCRICEKACPARAITIRG